MCSLSFYEPPQDGPEDTDDARKDWEGEESSADEENYFCQNEDYYDWRGIEPIHDACKVGDFEQVRRMVAIGAKVCEKDSERRTPVHYACEGGHLDILEFLISNGASVRAKSRDGKQPLHKACEKGHIQIVKTLLSKGADVDIKTADRRCTPLHVACEAGHLDIVKLLLSSGSNVNEGESYGCTPLHHACKGGHPDMVELLLSGGASLQQKAGMGKRPLHIACESGHVHIVESLLSHGAKVDEWTDRGCTALHFACEGGHLEVVKLLISKGAEVGKPKRNGMTPLHIACHNSHSGIVQTLLAHGARVDDTDTEGKTPLHYASKSRHHDKTVHQELANEAIADYDETETRTPLHSANTKEKAHDIAKALLVHGAQVNCKDSDTKTPLYYACKGKNLELVQTLLENGAHIGDEDEPDALEIACAGGSIKIVETLLNAGPQRVSAIHATKVLFTSCAKDRPDIVKLLLAHGARVDTSDSYGRTPLRHAHSAEVARILLSHGADINTPNVYCTGLEPCAPSILSVLLDHGAWPGGPCRKYNCQCQTTELRCRYHRALRNSKQADVEAFEKYFRKLSGLSCPFSLFDGAKAAKSQHWSPIRRDDQTATMELKAMKNDTIGNTSATYHDLLSLNYSALRNQPILESFNENECSLKYSIYGDMIICSYLKLRRAHMEQQSTYFFTLTLPELPVECAEIIIKHLSTDDLKNVLKVCRLT